MDVTFLFLDESVDLDAAWLTGVFVPAEQYADTRDSIIRIARDVLIEAGHERPHPTELHGVDLLRGVPGVTDCHRIKVFEDVVTVVNAQRIEVISVGHDKAQKTRQDLADMHMDPGEKFYSHNFYEMVEVLRLPEQVLVQPVFDGVPRQRPGRKREPVDGFAYQAFLNGAFITHWYRIAAERRPISLVQYKENLRNLAEPIFSDAAQSPLLQLADMIGYLLGVAERVERGGCSDWKIQVANAASKIDRELVHRRSVTTHFQANPPALGSKV